MRISIVMNQFRRLGFLAFFLSLSIHLIAQKDPQAEAMMDKMATIIDKAPAISADFDYRYQNVRTKEDNIASGKIWIKGNRYRISLTDNEMETYFDGKTLWSYLESTNEVNISTPDASSDDFFMNNPLAIFHIYKQDYKLKYLQDDSQTNNCEIDLYPLDIQKPFHRLRLTIDKITGQLVKVQAAGKNGDSYEVKLSKMETGKQLDDSFFIFQKEKFPGVVIIDLRN